MDTDEVPGANGLHSLDAPPSDPSDAVVNPTAPSVVAAGVAANGNGTAAISAELAPPAAIQGMPPLSTAAMSSFASAEKGVVEGADGANPQGLVQLPAAGANGAKTT